MFNLIRKDFLILRRYLLVAPLYGFLACFFFSNMSSGALSAAAVGAAYMLISYTGLSDDKNKSELMLNSLPLRRRDIVLAKYLISFLYAALAILFFQLAQGVAVVSGYSIGYRVTLEGIVGALVAMMVMVSLYYPLYFKLGYLRTRLAGTIMFFAFFFALPFLLIWVVHGGEGINNPVLRNIIASLHGLLVWLQSLADWQVTVYVLGLALIFMAISVTLSLRFYTQREF